MKRYYILMLLFLLPALCFAEPRGQEQALKIAEEFLGKVQTRASGLELEMVWNGSESRTRSESPAFFVFDNVSGPGYVIVSGDDKVIPVLGYSFENDFDTDNMPPHLVSWMDEIENQIRFVSSSSLYKPRSSVESAYMGNVQVKYETAKWNQGAPYNNDCPLDNGSRSVTGCLCTAMAILMKYHEWPDAGQGTIPSYVTSTRKITVPARTLGEPYDWDNMPLIYGSNNSSAQKAAVARLMADCGAAVMMDYTSGSSGAPLIKAASALIEYMKYDKSLVRYSRGYFSDTVWHEMVQEEIRTHGPMLYCGYSQDSGHAFILDGYTDNNYYSLNWGWGGAYDGYFVLDALNPDGQGIGGNASGYNLNQETLFNVSKDRGGAYQDLLTLELYYSDNGTIRGGIEIVGGEQLEKDVPFAMNAGLVTNSAICDYSGKFAVVIADSKNNVKEIIKEYNVSRIEPQSGYVLNSEYTFTCDVAAGDQLILVYWDRISGKWEKIRGNRDNGIIDSIPVVDGLMIDEETSLSFNTVTREISIYTMSNVMVEVVGPEGEEVGSYLTASGEPILLDTSSMAAGRYKITFRREGDYKELYFVIGSKEESHE